MYIMSLSGRNGKEQKPVPTQLVQRRKSDTTVKTKTGLSVIASFLTSYCWLIYEVVLR